MQSQNSSEKLAQWSRIAQRLKFLRESRGLTQDELARRMGLPCRQTLTSIEGGHRTVSSEELVRASEALDVGLDIFTDPHRLVGEGRFSFRADSVSPETVQTFEATAGGWVATHRTLLQEDGVSPSRLHSRLDLVPESSFEEAHAAAEEVRREWGLGDVPAALLPGTIERELGAQVLFVDAPSGMSGAAVRLPGHQTILVNRREPAGRRNFDIAHELFHLLTWDSMPPDRVEPTKVPGKKGNRVERLAENFAGALLMPVESLFERWDARGGSDLPEWLNVAATALGVSSVALKWRLVVLGILSRNKAEEIDDAELAANGGLDTSSMPLLFNRDFVARIHRAVETGRLSLTRATGILGLARPEFGALCRAYGLQLSYDV